MGGWVPSAESDAEDPVVGGVNIHKPSGDHLQRGNANEEMQEQQELAVVWFLQGAHTAQHRYAELIYTRRKSVRAGPEKKLGFIIPSWQAPTSHLELRPAHR